MSNAKTPPDRRRLRPGGPAPLRPLRARRARPARLPRRRGPLRGRRRHRGRPARGAEPRLRGRRAGAQDRPAHQGRERRVSIAERLRHRPRLPGAAGERARARGAASCRWCSSSTRTAASIPHIEDIARRLAVDNFIAFAPDALFPLGGYPGDEDKARDLFGKLDQAKTREDMRRRGALPERRAGRQRQARRGRLLLGRRRWSTSSPRACPSSTPRCRSTARRRRATSVAAIKAPLLLHFAEQRRLRQQAGWPAYEAALKAAGKCVPGVRLSGHPARLQQRHHAALRRRGRRPGLAAHAGVLQPDPARLTAAARSVQVAALALERFRLKDVAVAVARRAARALDRGPGLAPCAQLGRRPGDQAAAGGAARRWRSCAARHRRARAGAA